MSFAPVVVRDVSADDEQEFLLLLEPLLPTAHRVALGLLRSESDAEDAVQSAGPKAWRHFGQFRRVQATLNGLEIVGTQSQVTVSGDWTCHFTPNLGPA